MGVVEHIFLYMEPHRNKHQRNFKEKNVYIFVACPFPSFKTGAFMVMEEEWAFTQAEG